MQLCVVPAVVRYSNLTGFNIRYPYGKHVRGQVGLLAHPPPNPTPAIIARWCQTLSNLWKYLFTKHFDSLRSALSWGCVIALVLYY